MHDGPRPEWLDEALRASLDDVGTYPNAVAAEAALARRHGREASEVLATAGAAEAFALIARARDWTRPVVVHPQFTEPDVALTAAGHPPEHVLLDAGAGFALDPALVPDDADLVVVGNPTNPTSVLHPESALRALARPGRILVVDEAFMDSVPAEQHSLASARIPGVVVVRSLTKLWSIPGVRAGYVLAEPTVIAELRAQQSPWSVSDHRRGRDGGVLRRGGGRGGGRPRHTSDPAPLRAGRRTHRARCRDRRRPGRTVRARPRRRRRACRLRSAGYAVRRADTFPGLDATWVRIAVRRPDTTRKLLAVLRTDGGAP